MQLPSYSSVLLHTHMLTLPKPVESSTGSTDKYWDGIGACLCSECIPHIKHYFEHALFFVGLQGQESLRHDSPEGVKRAWPIATGASGAIILGLLGRGTYLAPSGKLHGPLWRNLEWAKLWGTVALVDDCIFTGNTMDYMHAECSKVGLMPVGEIVLLGERPIE